MRSWKAPLVCILLLLLLNASLIVAHLNGAISLQRWVFIWVIGSMSDLAAAFLVSWKLWHGMRNERLAIYLSMLLAGIVAEGICALVANIYPPEIKSFTLWYTCWFWTGRLIKTLAVWMLLLFLEGILNGDGPKPRITQPPAI